MVLVSLILSAFFLIFVGGARGFAISAPSGPVTAGDVLVSWRHDNGDPNDFFIRLRSAPGNDNGPFTQVNSNGQSQGQTKVHMDPGQYQLEIFTSQSQVNQGPRASSPQFTVEQAHSSSPQHTDTPPSRSSTTSTTSSTQGQVTGINNGSGSTTTTQGNQQEGTTTTSTSSTGSTNTDSAGDTTSTSQSSYTTTVISSQSGKLVTMTLTLPANTAGATQAGDSSGSQNTASLPDGYSSSTLPFGSPGSTGSPPSSAALSSRMGAGALVGIVLGVIAFILVIVAFFVLCMRRNRKEQTKSFYQDMMVRKRGFRSPPDLIFTKATTPSMEAQTATAAATVGRDLESQDDGYSEKSDVDLSEYPDLFYTSETTQNPRYISNPYTASVYSTSTFDPNAIIDIPSSPPPIPQSPTPAVLYSTPSPSPNPPAEDFDVLYSTAAPSSNSPSAGAILYSTTPSPIPPVLYSTPAASPLPPMLGTTLSPYSAANRSALGLAPPLTDRQMAIHERIVDLQAQMISSRAWRESVQLNDLNENKASARANGFRDGARASQIRDIQENIAYMQNLMHSPWALGLTDAQPEGYQ